jgi:hypothetical protein
VTGLGIKSAILAVLAGFAACAGLPASPALAGEVAYCVTCTGPDQTYLCKVVGEGSRPNDALKLYCIIRTAKEGNHASCKAKRDLEGCVGQAKIYSYDGPSLPAEIADDPRAKKIIGKLAREQKKFEKPKGEGPQTLVELTSRAMSSSRQGLRNAREAITGPNDEAKASPETTASTAPPSPQVSAPAPQAAAPAQQASAPPPQTTAALPAPLPATTAPAAKPPSPSRMQRASSAVGSFARKSYHCMWSWFRNCSGEPAKSTE